MTEKEFTQMYERLQPKVSRLCLGYVYGDQDVASDLIQQTFINAWKYRKSFKQQSSIDTWVYCIAVNCCLGYLKKKRPVKLQEKHVVSLKNETTDTEDEPDIKRLYQCIDKLKPINKTVVLMELEEIPQQEIAATLGYSHGSIRTRISRIKEQLLKCLSR
ncbi:RNA polymerase sigma factor [Nonlabens ponticola]|uniref:RNA polymerase sigma factor n=1 Tax=Nonlabens ponticola TaxID=2496866 RepID=A0A3S9MVH3_9FLAO|nr:RNA polymerase sigma factor [Nonlabens ponticola]AZQ43198.1 RNA polymerase sigma factor [Nonlabens ponticola]